MPPKRKKVRPSFTVAVEVAPLRDQLQDLVKHPARAFDGDGPTPCALWQAALDAVDRESKRRASLHPPSVGQADAPAEIGTQSLLGSLAPELLTHILSLITDWSTPWTSSALNVVLGTNRAFLALRPEVLREWCARYLFSEVSFPSDSTVFASASFLDFESEALRLVETASDPSALRRLLLTCQGPEWYRRRSPPAIHPICFGVDLEYLLEGVNQRVIFGVCGCGETDEDPIDTWQLAGRGFFPEFQSWKAQLDASKPLHRRDQRCPWCSSTESYTILNDTAKVVPLSSSPSFMGSRALIKWFGPSL